MAAPNAVQSLLAQIPLTELCNTKQTVLTLEHNISVGEAMKLLAKHRILSAPLVAGYDLEDVAEVGANTTPTLLGWIDVQDILKGFLRYLRERHNPLPTKMLQLMTTLEAEGPEFTHRMAVTLTGGHDRGLFFQANSNNTLLQVIRDVFLQPNEDSRVVHRIAVFDAHGEVTNIISQTDVIRFLHRKLPQLGGVGGQTLQQLGLLAGKPPVVSVSPHIPTLLAYEHMLSEGVSGAAVVADSGELIANLSLSELRCIQAEHFGALALPVGEFLALLHGTVYVGYSFSSSGAAAHPFFARGGAREQQQAASEKDIRLITCQVSTTFQQLLDTLVEQHVHRVYVVDAQDHPRALAVITLTDVLRLVGGVW